MLTNNSTKKRLLNKVLVLFVAVTFLANFVLNDAHSATGTPGFEEITKLVWKGSGTAGVPVLDVQSFSIPSNLGTVKLFAKGNTDKFVIHIQDAHCNYAAQKKTAEIIDYLVREYGLKNLNLEGGAGEYDLGVFTSIADPAVRDKVSDHFVGQGLVNGAEYYALNHPEKVSLWGLEEPGLYMENLAAYRGNLKYVQKERDNITRLSDILRKLKKHIYSKELLEIDGKYEDYKNDSLGFKDYVMYLIRLSKDRLVDIKTFPNLYLLYLSILQEGTVNFKNANLERDALISKLESVLSKKSLEELLIKTVAFRSNTISPYEFYDLLIKKARLSDISLDNYPEFLKYTVYISLYYSADRAKVLTELTKFEQAITATMCENDKQKELVTLSRNLVLLKNLFAVSLTKEDYLYYLDNKASFDMGNFVAFINREAPAYKLDASMDKSIADMDGYRNELARFYDYSFKRDDVFIKNIAFSRGKQRTAIVVTGGFHTENLCDLYKKNGISYISIIPNFTVEKAYESPYFRLLGGEEGGIYGKLSKIMTAESAIQIASMLSRNIADPVWGKANVNAFRAAVVLQSRIGDRVPVDVRVEGADIVLSLNDGSLFNMPLRELVDKAREVPAVVSARVGQIAEEELIAPVEGEAGVGGAEAAFAGLSAAQRETEFAAMAGEAASLDTAKMGELLRSLGAGEDVIKNIKVSPATGAQLIGMINNLRDLGFDVYGGKGDGLEVMTFDLVSLAKGLRLAELTSARASAEAIQKVGLSEQETAVVETEIKRFVNYMRNSGEAGKNFMASSAGQENGVQALVALREKIEATAQFAFQSGDLNVSPEGAAQGRADRPRERQEVVTQAGREIERRNDTVKILIGAPYDDLTPEVFNAMQRAANAFNSKIRTKFGENNDNKQIILFKIYKGDAEKTTADLKRAMDSAVTLATALPPEKSWNIIVYAPEMEDLQVASSVTDPRNSEFEKYRKNERITFVQDGYVDAYKGEKLHAVDMAVRFVLGRDISNCLNASTDEAKTAGLRSVADFLKLVTGEDVKDKLKSVDDLKQFLASTVIKINPIDYGELTDYMNTNTAVAVSL